MNFAAGRRKAPRRATGSRSPSLPALFFAAVVAVNAVFCVAVFRLSLVRPRAERGSSEKPKTEQNSTRRKSNRLPNIVFMLADDLGFNDVPWNNPSLNAPNLAALAKKGVVLNWFYTEASCGPSRAALLTGLYPGLRGVFGLQHITKNLTNDWRFFQAQGLRTGYTLLPQHLKRRGYKTHMIGKWHLGFCNDSYLPTKRGFQTFSGFLSGSEDYYRHTWTCKNCSSIYDFFDNEDMDFGANGTYSTNLFSAKADKIIRRHAETEEDNPFFLYIAYQNIHTPHQVPIRYLDRTSHDSIRRTILGSLLALDESVGKVVTSLVKNNLFDNTIIVFASDNGGSLCHGGNNYPLRGEKWELWEGGIRVPAVVVNPQNPSAQGQEFNGLFHMTDWLPTFLSMAGAKYVPAFVDGPNGTARAIDGIDQSEALMSDLSLHPRKEVLSGMRDPKQVTASLIVGDYKLIRQRTEYKGKILKDKWQEKHLINPSDVKRCTKQRHIKVVKATHTLLPHQDGLLSGKEEEELYEMLDMRDRKKVMHYLYNLKADPSESRNLIRSRNNTNLEIARRLISRLNELRADRTVRIESLPETMEADGRIHRQWCTAMR